MSMVLQVAKASREDGSKPASTLNPNPQTHNLSLKTQNLQGAKASREDVEAAYGKMANDKRLRM